MLALVDGQPQTLGAQGDARALHRAPPRGHPPPHASSSSRRRASAAHILEGCLIALHDIDEIIRADPRVGQPARGRAADGHGGLAQILQRAWRRRRQGPSSLTRGAGRILDMQLRRLAALERHKLAGRVQGADQADRLPTRTSSPNPRKIDLTSSATTCREIKEKYGDDRRTEIVDAGR